MPRSSSSNLHTATAPQPYRLTTPPLRRWISPMNFVARGHGRRRVRGINPGGRARFAEMVSPGSPTDPESSPTIHQSNDRTLRRTYSMLEPTHYPDIASCNASRLNTSTVGSSTDSESESVQSGDRQSLTNDDALDFDLDDTPITGIEIGQGVFRLIKPEQLSIAVFDAPMSFDNYIYLRTRLDTSNGGLTSTQFRDIVGQCGGCERFMLVRGKDHHRCPGKNALPRLVPKEQLFSLLSTTGGQGLTTIQLRELFVSCIYCNLIFTREAASHHVHYDSDDLDV